MTALCLACSSSLPPKSSHPIFTTTCCSRPICPSCITANPRLAQYDPCLACLGGVAVVGSGRVRTDTQQELKPTTRNVNRDEETFVIGDDEFEDDDDVQPSGLDTPAAPKSNANLPSPAESAPTPSPPAKYYIKRGDTLQGISLRFGLDVSTFCAPIHNAKPSSGSRAMSDEQSAT
jgi:hypothetical protein